MPALPLVPLSSTRIRIGQPLPFAIYDTDGRLLLSPGEAPRNARHIERIHEVGMVTAEALARIEAASTPTVAATLPTPPPEPPAHTEALRASVECLLTALRLPSGATVQLSQDGDPPRLLSATLIGVLPRAAIYLGVLANDERAPLAASGAPVAFRCVHGSEIVRFESRVLRQDLLPFPLAVLDYPADVSVQRFRRYPRAPTSLNAVATNYTAPDAAALPCRVTNISAGGLQLECATPVIAAGDQVGIDLVLPGSVPRYALKLVGTVRSVSATEDPDQQRCGVEFSPLDANERLLLEHFVLRTLAERPRVAAVR